MKDIGYVVKLADFGPCKSTSDYISYSEDSLYKGAIVLSIDFNLEKIKNLKIRVKLKNSFIKKCKLGRNIWFYLLK